MAITDPPKAPSTLDCCQAAKPKKKRRSRKVLLLVCANALVVLALVAGAEFFLSFFVSRPVDTLVPHPHFNHMMKPYSRETHREFIAANPDFPDAYTHTRNAQGWLETYDVATTKPPNTYRVFYLGDSFTEGTCTMDASMPSVVEAKLDEMEEDGGLSIEVINAGTTSYSPTIYYILTRYVLLEYDPDLIVVNVDMTDDFDDWKYARLLTVDDAGNPVSVSPMGILGHEFIEGTNGIAPATPRERVRLFLRRYSYIYNTLDRVKARLGIVGDAGAGSDSQRIVPANTDELYQRYSWCRDEWDDVTERCVKRTTDMLRRLATLCAENDVKLMMTAVPQYWQYAGNANGDGPPRWSSRPHEAIGKLASEIGVPYLNSFEALAPVIRGTVQTKYYYSGDMHFNPRGYAAWAACQLAFLTDRRNALLPEAFLANLETSVSGRLAGRLGAPI